MHASRGLAPLFYLSFAKFFVATRQNICVCEREIGRIVSFAHSRARVFSHNHQNSGGGGGGGGGRDGVFI